MPLPFRDAPTRGDDRRSLISALADGEAAALDSCCAAWRDDAAARRTWHAYHLIGDVLRSEELAAAPTRDAAFLAALRARLAAEPVPLAPPRRSARRAAWLAPVAAAAGLAAVAGVVVVARTSLPGDTSRAVVAAGGQPGVTVQRTGAGQPAGPVPVQSEGRMVRDPQLDAYLRAHRQAMGGVPRAIETAAPVAQPGR